MKDNGRRVRESIDDLNRSGLLLKHKSGKTISLNPKRLRDILDMTESEAEP